MIDSLMRSRIGTCMETAFIVASILFVVDSAIAPAAQEFPTPTAASVESTGHLVYDTKRDGCDNYDVPDAPARAFRDSQGMIHFFATSSANRAMIGRNFGQLKRVCDVVYRGNHDPRPWAYSDYSWLTGFYADGNIVYGLIHNEFHGHERPELCPSRNYGRCWENSITAAISHDGGYHFERLDDGTNTIAILPYKYKGDQEGLVGYLNPTSILKHDNFYYAMFTAIDRVHPDRSGVCVIRTSSLGDPRSWRAWNGQSFDTRFINPYKTEILDTLAHTCQPVGKDRLFFSLGSLLWKPDERRFLLLMRFQRWDKPSHGETPGAYISMSANMIDWSAPVLILSDEQAQSEPPSTPQLYPSLIDPDASSSNFDSFTRNGLLFTMTTGPEDGYGSWKLWSREVHFR